MKNIRKHLSTLLAICLLLITAAIPAAAAPEAGQERVTVYFGNGEKNGFRSDEPASVTLTAQVPQDGTYLLDLYAEGAWMDSSQPPVAVSSPDEALAVVNDRESYGDANGGVICLVELTAGEYTIQAENACSLSADLTLAYPIESVLDPMVAGTYVCTLDEAITVNYTLIGSDAHAEIYNGAADDMREVGSVMAWDKEGTGELNTDQNSISFEPGAVVIDFRDNGRDATLEGAAADAGTNEAAVLKGESIEFVDASDESGFGGISSHSADEPATGTATIQGDGYYFLDVDLTTYWEGDEFTFSSDIPALPDLAALPDWATAPVELLPGDWTDETQIHMVTDVASGEYTMTVGNVMCYASFFPVQTVDSLTGDFDGRGVYVCFLDETAQVTYTIDEYSAEWVHFYGGAGEDGFLQDLTPEMDLESGGPVEVTVQFPAGAAVIDAHIYQVDSLTGVQS